jgi:CRISPR/Cas system endoribonuclease Cas6 (RAMP superfamily)
MDTIFKVYWTGVDEKPYAKDFIDMSDALKFTQELRNNHHRRFVSMVSENPDNATKLGVAEVGSDYNWKKRR